jgi:hypothetical protein
MTPAAPFITLVCAVVAVFVNNVGRSRLYNAEHLLFDLRSAVELFDERLHLFEFVFDLFALEVGELLLRRISRIAVAWSSRT